MDRTRLHEMIWLLTFCAAAALVGACGDDSGSAGERGDEDDEEDAGEDAGDTDTEEQCEEEECGGQEVAHPDSGLVWKRCPVGGNWEWSDGFCECQCIGGTLESYAWDDIHELCDDGWRVATIDELLSLLDGCEEDIVASGGGTCDPCQESDICSEMFPGEARFFWSATEHNTDTAFSVAFNVGTVSASDKGQTFYVRCVEE